MGGSRQKELLNLLLQNKSGLTVEEFAQRLGITRNAVRQHLESLEARDLVQKSDTRPSGGRPEQLYVLTEKGNELFPRHYAWFAQLLLEMVEAEVGPHGIAERLDELGRKVAASLAEQDGNQAPATLDEKVRQLAGTMEQLGYSARSFTSLKGIPIIEANNCVFHELARQHPMVCRFDLALLSAATGADVEHLECMAKGGTACKFRFHEQSGDSEKPE